MGIDEAWLQNLVSTRQEEHERLEFKLTLPARDGKGKHEFLKDVVGMANAAGGHIIYGIGEDDGAASKLAALGPESADAEILRLEQSLAASVEPRMAGVRLDPVALSGGGYALVVTVPRSFSGPHRVTLENKNVFYVRAQRHVHEYSYSHLRDAFTLQGRAQDRIREFRAERLARIKANNGALPLFERAKSVVHVLPVSAFAATPSLDVSPYRRSPGQLLYGDYPDARGLWNLDGIAATCPALGEGQQFDRYVQLFRSGAVETVQVVGTTGRQDEKVIASRWLAEDVRAALARCGTLLDTLGVSGPCLVAVSVLSCMSQRLAADKYSDFSSAQRRADRDDLLMPEVWLDSPDELTGNVDDVARPVLDTVWQCFNLDSCGYYAADGRWTA
jgi:enamine deaminase RidA (YjgF/YER057c/UK114 family)